MRNTTAEDTAQAAVFDGSDLEITPEEIRRNWTQCEGDGTSWDVARERRACVNGEGDELGPNLEGVVWQFAYMPTGQWQNYEAVPLKFAQNVIQISIKLFNFFNELCSILFLFCAL